MISRPELEQYKRRVLALILKTNSEKEKQRETYNRNGDNQEWCE